MIRGLHGQSWADQAKQLANELLGAGVADRLRGLIGRTVRAPEFLDLAKLGAEPRSPHESSVDLRDPVRSLSHAQLTALNLPMLLHWEDRDSMAHSLEARLPFLDYRLVEFCLGLPEDYKLSDGWTKRVLREGMRGRLPERVRLRRDKLGFATAEETWMRGERQPAGQAVAGRRARDDDAESENGSEEPHQRRRTQIPTLQHAGPGGQQDEADPAQDSGHEPVAERCRGLTAVAAREGCLWNRGVHPDQDCGRDQDEAGAGHIHLHGERLLTASRQRRPGGPGRFAPHVGDARRRERQ